MAQTKKTDIVIIGGGASGLMCASCIEHKSVLILEKADKIGKKILVTGNGRCNLTHDNIDVRRYNTDKIQPYLDRFGVGKTLDYFRSLGLMTYSDDEGRVYPTSDSANSVLDVLRLRLDSKDNVSIMTGVDIVSITRSKSGYTIKTSDMVIEADYVVLAIGGLSGSKYLDSLGVGYTPYRKSLGAMASEKNVGLHGVKADRVQVTLELCGKNYSQNGEILFKEDAVSGIVIFNLSAYIARENVCDGYLYINFFKDMKMSEVKDMLTIRKNTLKGSKIQDYFVGLLHKAIGQSILKRSGLDVTKSIATLNQKDIDTLASLLTRYAVRVYGVKDNNQVYSGGVGLDTLDSSLQVKGSTGLYCTGELIDVDGECGGYNLQWAWTSGMVVADALNKVTKGK